MGGTGWSIWSSQILWLQLKVKYSPKIWELSLCCFVTKKHLAESQHYMVKDLLARTWVWVKTMYLNTFSFSKSATRSLFLSGSRVTLSERIQCCNIASDASQWSPTSTHLSKRTKGKGTFLRGLECCNSYPNANEITFAVILYYQLWCQLICQREQREWIEGAQGCNS